MAHTESSQQLVGTVALMLTPFHTDGSIDWQTYARYTAWQASHHPAGLFAVCGSSEMKWLTRQERVQLVSETVKYADGLPVIATCNLDPDPGKHPDEARQIEAAGASGVVLIPAPHVSGDNDRYYDYLCDMSQQVSCPVYVYEWPQTSNHLMDTGVFKRLTKNNIIAGIKDTTCTVEGIQQKQDNANNAIVYQANMAYLMEAFDRGVRGIMAITSTAKADLIKAFCDAYPTNKGHAAALHRELALLDMVLRPAYPATAKYLVNLQGIEMSTCTRWPTNLTPETCCTIDIWYEGVQKLISTTVL